jgi:hypothetical protein
MLSAVVLIFPIWPALRLYRADPAFGGNQPVYRLLIDRLGEEVGPGDAVVIDPYASPLWGAMINDWSSPVPWYSLPIELPGASEAELVAEPGPEVQALLRQLLDSSATVWYAAAGEVPPASAQSKLQWLEQHAALAQEIVLGDVTPAIVLRAYRR